MVFRMALSFQGYQVGSVVIEGLEFSRCTKSPGLRMFQDMIWLS
jgi:hypothetical protein